MRKKHRHLDIQYFQYFMTINGTIQLIPNQEDESYDKRVEKN